MSEIEDGCVSAQFGCGCREGVVTFSNMGGTYTGLIHKDPESDYGVSFPDLPGCISAGRTVKEAREMAVEALALHLEALEEYGEEIPKSSTADAVLTHPGAHDALALLVVEAMPAPAEIA